MSSFPAPFPVAARQVCLGWPKDARGGVGATHQEGSFGDGFEASTPWGLWAGAFPCFLSSDVC